MFQFSHSLEVPTDIKYSSTVVQYLSAVPSTNDLDYSVRNSQTMKKYKEVSSIRLSSSPDHEDDRSSIPLLKRTIPRFRVSLPSRPSPPPKTTLAAIFMLFAGTIFLGAGRQT